MSTIKHILITGANGQLGHEMSNVLNGNQEYVVYLTDIDELDITDEKSISEFFESHQVDVVVNCAAFTAVDKAESNVELCSKINIDAISLIAKNAVKHNAKIIHVSTDYVFDGNSCVPYKETDIPNPLTVYGSTKLSGEKALLDIAPDSIILRTAWLYSPYGKNFVKTMLELGRTHESLQVVVDQVGSPTSAADLASAINSILKNNAWHSGIYHFSNEGAISWYDFTHAIHRLAGINTCKIVPCNSSEYPTPAHRPHYSVLDKSKIKKTFGITIPYWEDSLAKCIETIELNNN